MKFKIQTLFSSITLIVAVAITLSSCKKENAAPVVVLSSPGADVMISLADTVKIQGTVSDDASLHEMSVLLIKSTGDTVFQDYPYVHDLKTYPFLYYFHPTTTGTYTLHVTAEDHMSAHTEKTASIMVI